MVKVITYGTFDLLHHGHIRLLERAKALGDYLIVGVTADNFDKERGKINVRQSLSERLAAVKACGIADEVIVEEYEGQKIDDILRYGVDIFTVGSDWVGKFDYLNDYCKVIYLDRTEGVSSSELRTEMGKLRIGLVGSVTDLVKFVRETKFVNGVEIAGICTNDIERGKDLFPEIAHWTTDYAQLLTNCDTVYVASHPNEHEAQIRAALERGIHVLCETPIAKNSETVESLFALAKEKNLTLMEALKTAYSTAFSRLILLVKSGKIGRVVSVDATCTSLREVSTSNVHSDWSTLLDWGPIAMLPVFRILGTHFSDVRIISLPRSNDLTDDAFTKLEFRYDNAVASVKIGSAIKSEGDLIISGTKGYIYVPAPWWKTDYFEIRFENPAENQRVFYQLEGEGIRFEIVAFSKAIETGAGSNYIPEETSSAIADVIQRFEAKKNVFYI